MVTKNIVYLNIFQLLIALTVWLLYGIKGGIVLFMIAAFAFFIWNGIIKGD